MNLRDRKILHRLIAAPLPKIRTDLRAPTVTVRTIALWRKDSEHYLALVRAVHDAWFYADPDNTPEQALDKLEAWLRRRIEEDWQ